MTQEKDSLRGAARTRRATLAQNLPDFAQRIARFAERIGALNAGPVGGYLPLPDEADPRLLMSKLIQLDHVVAVPCIAGRRSPLVYHRWSPGDETILNAYGIPEPAERMEVIVPATVLVPLLAFDSSGRRLGYGGGYYDRTLDRLRDDGSVVAVGVAFAEQELKELPSETHDHALDMVLTEQGIRIFS